MTVEKKRIIKIFLASSITDTASERDRLQNKITQVWDPIFNTFGVKLELIRCEYMSKPWPNRNQAAIDNEICHADVFIVIFKNRIGEHTFHEFDVARKSFLNTGTPHIYPYISSTLIKQKEEHSELIELTKNNTYPETFTSIEAIEINLLERLGNILSLPISPRRNGTVTVNGLQTDFGLSSDEVSKAYLLRQKEYIDFTVDLLKPIYKGTSFVKYLNQEFPNIVLEADPSVRKFDIKSMRFDFERCCSLLSLPSTPVSGAEMDTLKTLYNQRRSGFILPYQFYHYMNDEIQLNESGKITGLSAYVALSSRNMISTTALRSELEILYEEMKTVRQTTPQATLKACPIRFAIHQKIHQKTGNQLAPLLKGQGRYSGIGLQLLVLFPVDPKNACRINPDFENYVGKNPYWTTMLRRSENAWEQPGFYQFAPCGNFIIFDEPEAAGKDRNVQEQHFNFFQAILHHYVRELFNDAPEGTGNKFGDSTFDKPEHTAMYNKTAMDPHADELYDMLADGRATLEFLGASSPLTTLKSDLVFLLTINDDNYFNRNKLHFKSDFQTSSLRTYPVEYLMSPDFLEEECCLAQEIAGPLELLCRRKKR